MKTKTILAIAAASAVASLAPATASANIFTYNMTNGDVLEINTDTSSALFQGTNINARMTSDSFANFAGGSKPSFNFVLDSLSGKRLIRGQWVEPNPVNSTTTHPQLLKGYGDGKFNLWAYWGDPIIGGDYISWQESYTSSGGTSVPAPGMLGMMALALGGLFWGRRRKVKLSFGRVGTGMTAAA